jgi:hypothetical protein
VRLIANFAEHQHGIVRSTSILWILQILEDAEHREHLWKNTTFIEMLIRLALDDEVQPLVLSRLTRILQDSVISFTIRFAGPIADKRQSE